jgi:hypothetical protein
MDTFDRNVAIIGSAVYGGVLVIGMLLFVLGHTGEPFYTHPSTSIAIFSVFWFAFSPSLLFIGATVPWVCVLCGSRAAALTFAVVPGGLFVLIGAYWIFLNDKHRNFYYSLEVPGTSPWSRSTANANNAAAAAAPYRVRGAAEHFPSPADVAEMMQRGSSAYHCLPYPYPAGEWGRRGGVGGGGAPAFASIAAAAAPGLANSHYRWPGYGPTGTAAGAYPLYGPSFSVPTSLSYNGSTPTAFHDGGGGAVLRGPQSAHSHSPSPPTHAIVGTGAV